MDPQSCTKCNCLPEDILMLACSHDLCLNCAADRLAFEMKKKKNPNSIVCEFCYERTPLDGESVGELEKLISPAKLPTKSYVEVRNKPDVRSEKKYESTVRNPGTERITYQKTGDLGIDRGYDRVATSKVTARQVFSGISSKKSCNEHSDQEILYFCFDCMCECICPECIIHGKHKDHDVKTIRKAQPIVKSKIETHLGKLDNNIQGLQIRKSEIEKQMRALTEQNNISKRQIQQAFDDLRLKIAAQEKEILRKWDQNLSEGLEQLDRVSRETIKRMEQLQNYSATMSQAVKKEDILLLNYYSRKHRQIHEQEVQPETSVPKINLPSNQTVLAGVLDAGDQIVGSTTTSKYSATSNDNFLR